ncbi:MAG: hypothetical protein IJY22_01300 [Clostridia bacterium]|nr:hypothetical protein [Clostridia bacterium]
MKNKLKYCIIGLALLLCISFVGCEDDGAPIAYAAENCVHSFGDTWYDVAPAEGEAVTEQVHYCRICHAAEVRPKE